MVCLSSRAASLAKLDGFIPIAEHYARDRNHVIPGHPAVSRLSPAIRHRLITEEEVVSTVLRAHSFSRVEKFIQEVYWRRYWKSWLALRPEVWTEFLRDLEAIGENPDARRIEESQTGNRVIDHFANELVATGYLHNHARMWFAGWWVIDRPEDLRVRPFATGGFFQFWERLRKTLVTHSTGNDFLDPQTLIEFRQ
jgi:deoxyribodipyrimidine photo-lyase